MTDTNICIIFPKLCNQVSSHSVSVRLFVQLTDTQQLFFRSIAYCFAPDRQRLKLLSFYRDNRFSQFDTRLTASKEAEPHELVQLLRLLFSPLTVKGFNARVKYPSRPPSFTETTTYVTDWFSDKNRPVRTPVAVKFIKGEEELRELMRFREMKEKEKMNAGK